MLEDYQIRMLQEQKDLSDKITKLGSFISRNNMALDPTDLFLLRQQLKGMEQYQAALTMRCFCMMKDIAQRIS